MKRVLFVLAVIACMLSCRSVKSVGSTERHHYSNGADTLVAVSILERADSSSYFRSKIDSLSRELHYYRQMYRELYVKDSVNTNQYRTDSVSVKDTTWMQHNPDGSVTYHNYREKNTYSYQQLERYRQQIVKESRATIDSLIERNMCLQTRYDSLMQAYIMVDSLLQYEAKKDSISDAVNESQKDTIYKNDIFSQIRAAVATAIFLLVLWSVIYIFCRLRKR